MEVQPKIELGKKTQKEILDALKKIKSEISEAKKRQSTAADVAADVLASGGGPFAAVKQALSFKAEKTKKRLKDRFDPLNIINKATGSKLATAIAGRAIGRSEESIRSAAGLTQKDKGPQIPTIAEQLKETKDESKVTRIENEKMIKSLEFIAKTLAVLTKKVSDISDKLGATKKFRVEEGDRYRDLVTGKFASKDMVENEKEQADFLKKIWMEMKQQTLLTEKFRDEQRDRASAELYKKEFGNRKAAIVKDTVPQVQQEKEGGIGSWLSTIAKFIGPALLPLAAAIAPVVAAFGLLGAATKMVYDKWDDFKLSFSLLKDSMMDFYDTMISTVGKIKDWIVDTLTAGGDLIIDAGRSVVKGVKGLLGFKQTPEEERAELEKEAASGSGYAQRKLAKEVAPQAKVESAAEKLTPTITNDIESSSQTSVNQKSIDDGTLKQKVIDSLSGAAAPSGSMEDKAAVGKVTQAVAKVYRDTYKTEGPLRSDPQFEKRLPGVVDATLKSLSEGLNKSSLSETSSIPKVSELQPIAPKTGEMLSSAADLKADASMQTMTQQITPIINNIRNNNVNNNSLQQSLPNPRSSESSFMRTTTRDFATS